MPIYYWVLLLPDDLQKKVATNILAQDKCLQCVYAIDATDLQDALLQAFDWEKSNEGFDFWAEMFLNFN